MKDAGLYTAYVPASTTTAPTMPASRKGPLLGRAFRKKVKWGGLVVTVLLLVVWIGSGWWTAHWVSVGDGRVILGGGQLHFVGSFSIGRPEDTSDLFVDPSSWQLEWWFDAANYENGPMFAVPLWFPSLLSLLATGAAWRADWKYMRRVRVGLCAACGYDRAGLAAGSECPECGAAPGV